MYFHVCLYFLTNKRKRMKWSFLFNLLLTGWTKYINLLFVFLSLTVGPYESTTKIHTTKYAVNKILEIFNPPYVYRQHINILCLWAEVIQLWNVTNRSLPVIEPQLIQTSWKQAENMSKIRFRFYFLHQFIEIKFTSRHKTFTDTQSKWIKTMFSIHD